MSEKKVVSRSVALAFGILCIILMAGIGGVIAYYTTALANSNALHDDYVSNHSHTDDEYSALIDSLNSAQSQVDDLESILRLEKVETDVYFYSGEISLPANFSTEPKIGEIILSSDPPFGFYPGIARIQVSSSSNETYVTVTYSARAIMMPNQLWFDYYSQTDVGTNGTVLFPVLPTELINIRIAVHETSAEATAHVTITYYY